MLVAVIPARGGSTRIPRKNIRLFHGKPIIAYSIEAARMTRLFDAIYVSTEDDEIGDIAAGYGAYRLKRDERLAQNEVGTQEVMRNALLNLACGSSDPYGGIEAACCIYATAPLMDPADLLRGYRHLLAFGASYAFSVGTTPLSDAGQFYWGRPKAFINRKPLYAEDTLMVPVDSDRVCDINTEADWQRAERMYEEIHRRAA